MLARVFGLLESLISLARRARCRRCVTLDQSDRPAHRHGRRRRALCDSGGGAWRRLTRLDRYIGELDKEIALLHGVPMLQPLPLPAIEHLARGLEPVHVRAGQAVFRQGDAADRFYVIETGVADVAGNGRLVTTLGPGEGFGEIALLHRVRRTATVRATTDLQLQALACIRFLPIVTRFPPSAREAGTEVETMLDRFSPDENTDDQNGSRH